MLSILSVVYILLGFITGGAVGSDDLKSAAVRY